jgi:hypothetical protein
MDIRCPQHTLKKFLGVLYASKRVGCDFCLRGEEAPHTYGSTFPSKSHQVKRKEREKEGQGE